MFDYFKKKKYLLLEIESLRISLDRTKQKRDEQLDYYTSELKKASDDLKVALSTADNWRKMYEQSQDEVRKYAKLAVDAVEDQNILIRDALRAGKKK